MKDTIYRKGALLILVALLAGCSTATITTAHVTQPVMLGKVKKVHGQESEKRQQKALFDIKVLAFNDASDSSIADAELLKRIDSPEDEVVVDAIRVESKSSFIPLGAGYGFLPIPFDSCEAGILGGIYSSETGDHESE